MPYGFDQRFRPDRIHEYVDEPLRFQLCYPARFGLVDRTDAGDRSSGGLLRLHLIAANEDGGVLVLRVLGLDLESTLTREAARELVTGYLGVGASSLAHRYEREYGDADATTRSVTTLTFAGVPAVRWIGDVRLDDGALARVERTDAVAGSLVYTFESWTRVTDIQTRRAFRQVLASFRCEPAWAPAGGSGRSWAGGGLRRGSAPGPHPRA